MRNTARKISHQPHWAAPRVIRPAEGAFFTRPAAPALADQRMSAEHRRTIVRLLRGCLTVNIVLWSGLAIQAARLF